MKFFTSYLKVLLIIVLCSGTGYSQNCPSITALAGAATSTNICFGQCATLTASVVPVRAATTYSVGSITYAPYAFTGGNTLPPVDDVWSDSLNIGFNFCFFGNTYNKLVIGSNGEINFNKSLANTFNNYNVSTTLPNTIDLPGNSICGVFKDIDLSAGGVARTYTTGTAPCRKFVAYWSNVPLYQAVGDNCGSILNTFQIVLHETTNQVEIFVASTAPCGIGGNTDRGIIGIQNAAGTTAVAPATRNVTTPWTATNEGWRFNPTGANTYTVNWSGPNGFTSTGLTAAPCPTATSNYTATMNVANCNGSITSFSSSVQVSVTPIPSLTVTSNPSILCRGSSATLTAVGATNYTWTPGGATTSSIVVSPTVTTSYTISGANGNCNSNTTFTLTVSPIPTVTAVRNPTVICSGIGSSTLTSTGATSYTWNPGNLIGTPVIVSPTIATQYTVTGTNAAGCVSSRTVNLSIASNPTVTASASSATICAGSTVTLSSGGASTYTWTPGNQVGASVIAIPTANTTYTVRGRNAGGCIGTNTVSVVVTPGITFTTTATPTVICRGGTSTLTATGALSYTWALGSTISPSIIVSPTVTTAYSVTATNGGSCTATRIVTVTVSVPNITAARSPASICSGNSSTLTAGGGVTYTWSPGGMTGTPVVVSPSVTTTYTVTGTNALGCTNVRTAVVTVLANPNPTIVATSNSVCTGFTTTLTASGATTYTWNPGTYTTTSIAVTPSATTIYSLTGRNASGCSITRTINITVNPSVTVSPAASPSIICRGNTSTLTATGASTYTWNPGALTGTNVVVSPSTTTVYTVTGRDAVGCNGTSTLAVNVSTLNLVASSSPSILCSASTATLTGTGATTYTWEPGTLTSNTVVVTPAATTIYTLSGTNALGCTGTRTLNLSVGVTPTITAASSSSLICSGSTVTLTSTGGTNYTWMPGALTGSAIAVAPPVSRTYTVTGANASGCTSTNTVLITVNASPTISINADPTVLCPGFSSTLSATGADTYTWMPGATISPSVNVSPSSTIVYTVTGLNILNCTSTATVNLKVNPSPTVTAVSSPTAICSGATSTLTAIGAFSYTWNPGAITGSNVAVSPSVSTTYTVTGNNGLGCIDNATVTVDVLPTTTITAISSPTTICSGNTSTLTANGAISYTWNPGALTGSLVTVNPIVNTTYTVAGSNASGCVSTQTVDVNISNNIVSATASPTFICFGQSSTLNATGATSYTWNPGGLTGTSISVSPTLTTTYSVVTTNSLGCVSSNTVSVVVGALPTTSVSVSPTVICAGSTATLTGVGASTYTWNPGNMSGATVVVNPTATINYTVIGANALGCSSTATIDLIVNSAPSVTASSTSSVICSGNSVVLNAAGASSYTWNPGNLNSSIAIVSPSATTIYTLTGSNGGLCDGTSTVEITVNQTPTLVATSNPTVLCSGGSATLTASGASSYIWNPGSVISSSVIVTPTATTDYTVTGVTGACSNSVIVNLVVSTTPIITASATNYSICAGQTTSLTANGASSYTWMPSALTGSNVVVNPSANTIYSVTGDNGSGCISTQTIGITVNALPTFTAISSPTVLCSGETSTLTASGATSYTWNPGTITGSLITVSPSSNITYTVVADNGIGCTASQTVAVVVNPTPSLTLSALPSTVCVGGTSTLTASGATSYTWNPGVINGSTITVSPSATTIYTLTGSTGNCSSTQTINITVSPNIMVTAVSNPTSACAGTNVVLSATGASTYSWSPGALTGSLVTVNPTSTTTYTVNGDSGSGCIVSNTVTVNVQSAPTISVTATNTLLCSAGTITVEASGAINYTWSPVASNSATITDSPTATTTYTVIGDNAAGCVGTQTITINVGTNPTLTLTASSNTICLGNSTNLSASGASSYTWNPGNLTGTSVAVSPTLNTTYTVTGDNGIGCTNTETINITVAPAFTVDAVASSNTICIGANATLTGNGSSTYTWSPGAITGTSITVNPSVTTTYTVTSDNGIGCIASNTVTVNVNSIPGISISPTSTMLCSSGSVTMTATGATSYTWMPLAAVSATVFDNPSVTTTYTVTGEDAIGCTGSQTITINVSTTPSVSASTSTNNICAGTMVTLTANGASTYTWNPGVLTGTAVTVSPTVTTTYTVDGDNGFGCVDSETITVTVNIAPTLSVASTSTVLCGTGTITLTASGATNYTWIPGSANTTSITDSPTVTTTYTVSGDNGTSCISSETITVNVYSEPILNISATPVGTICVGTTATLTVNGASSYTWMPSAVTGSIITDAPSVTTTYTVTGDNGFGCTATNTFVLDVAPGASITAVANPTTACANSTVELSANGALTYTWMPVSVSGNSVIVSPSASTTYTVLGDNGTCIAQATVGVNINLGPANITATVSGEITCLNTNVDLFGNSSTSPVTYIWTGPGTYTSNVQNPTGVTTAGSYTLDVLDGITGCVSSTVISVNSNTTIPNLMASTSGGLGCASLVTLTATSSSSNTLTYLWNGPSSYTAAVQNPTTSIAGDYTVTANDAVTGCTSSATVNVGTSTVTPSFTTSVSGELTCIGDVTLIATPTTTDVVSYLWNGPASYSATTQNATTTIAGDYTVSVTDVVSGCSSTSTITVISNTIVPGIMANASGSVGCVANVTLTASSTSTNSVSYLWNGPASYTAATQSTTVSAEGDYTVTISDALTGCSSSTIVSVGINTVAPVVGIINPSPLLGCNTSVTLSVITATPPALSFNWSGPGGFTSALETPTTSIAGDYTVTVTDVTNGCSTIVSINIGTSTVIPVFSAAVTPATCSGTVANNDAVIQISGYASTDTYDVTQATTYTGTAVYNTANAIPFGGILTNTLSNPAVNTPYTIRLFGNNGCFKDTTVILVPTICTPTTVATVLGMTKAVSTPTYVNNNAYHVTYTVVAKNTSLLDINNFSVIDNLNNTFPLPTTYTVISAPVVTSLNSSITANAGFNGSAQNDLLNPLTSTLVAGRADTIVFTVQIDPKGFFGPFNNSAIGSGIDANGIAVADSSNNGFNWDPDNDGNPTNNNTPTVINLVPNTSIGVAKAGTVSEVLEDKTIDVTYTINVKNLGNDTIRFVQVMDSLRLPSPAQYTIKSGPTASGSLVSNSNYNGVSDIGLLDANLSKLAPGVTESITLVLNITPNGVKTTTNIAIGVGFGASGGIVKDSSNAGTEADPNGNGNATEPGENIPTVVQLPDVELFVPEVFTPDGDGKNDFFVIKGISGRTVKLTVFNRWGNKVYENGAYDNTWNGTPNVNGLLLGTNKLPQSTYYYIVEFEDGVDEPIKGYVVLQY